MLELVRQHYSYLGTFLLLGLGLYGMLLRQNLMKKLIGMSIFQSAVILFWVIEAYRSQATIPVRLPEGAAAAAGEQLYINPLPHTLMLTAIVVGVAMQGVGFALLIKIYRSYKTLEEPELLERLP